MSQTHILSGDLLTFVDDPFNAPPEEAVQILTDSALLIEGGVITARGPREALVSQHPNAKHHPHPGKLICPGFIDAHAHYPQTAMIASWGKRLIDWLNTYTFPEEMRFSDPTYAADIAARYLDLTAAHGTTTMASFCTIHTASVEALFSEASARGQRIVAGKTCMDRNAPEDLLDTAQTAYDDSKAMLEKWHNQARLSYAITPRFSPTSTPEQLEAMGALWSEHPDCLMQTHLSEQVDELEWVSALFPSARDYLETYENFGLLGERGLYGHAIYLKPREIDRLSEVGAALVHCPTSNTFIGSGLFDMADLKARGLSVGLATDTGGGSSFSMLRTMAAAYEIAQLKGAVLHAAQLLWLATQGSAKALHLNDKIGSLDIGMEADIAVIDLASTSAISQRYANARNQWDQVFPTIMMGDDRAIAEVWIGGVRQSIS
ncbi:guanine deaminase [Planktotalea sp.]|uniref:guanine deaminase n=1 Tax=Planktotalea sp. TaxID=2029877 RepID=UPI003D6AA0CD